MWRRLIYHPEVNYALRQTLVLCLPVAVGLIFGNLKLGLLFSLVPACCNMAGLDTPHKRFVKRLIVGATLFATCSLLTQILLLYHLPLPLLFLGLALLLGVTAEISPLHARLMPASLVAAIFTLSLAGNMPLWQPLAIYVLGTLWYGGFNSFWLWLWREQPMRETLSLLYREMARYCEDKYALLTHRTDPQAGLPPLLTHQQKVVDLINQCYEQLHMLSGRKYRGYKRLLRVFQVGLDLQEHISVSLSQPEEGQKEIAHSHAGAVVRWNARIIAERLRVLSDDILYHRYPSAFDMDEPLAALEKTTHHYPDSTLLQFCQYHFSRIAKVLTTQRPLYARDLMADRQRHLPLLRALKSYLSFKSPGLRGASRTGIMLALAALMGETLQLPKPWWILMTVMFVTQSNYGATRVRIFHRATGTMIGLLVAATTLHFHVPEGYTLAAMLLLTLLSYLITRKYYAWATIGFTVTGVYTLQLLSFNGEMFILPRLIDTLLGCLIAFGGMVWLWPQWQSGQLRNNAWEALEAEQQAVRLILSADPQAGPLAWQRMQVNQAHNALYNALNQAMKEPAFNSRYLADMKLWVTHSQFIVEHINAMTTLAREHTMLTPDLAESYLMQCEVAFQRCQQRLNYDEPGETKDSDILATFEVSGNEPLSVTELHLRRILGHLSSMFTISSLAWRSRPHHGIWLSRRRG